MSKQVFHANPPSECDLCEEAIDQEFADALIPDYGSWGSVCPNCAGAQRVGYGLGRGQRYCRQADGRYMKVEG